MRKSFVFKCLNKEFDFETNDNYEIVIENYTLFYETLFRLKNEDFLFFIDLISDDKKESVDDYVDVIQDLFLLDINCKKNNNALLKQIKKMYKPILDEACNDVLKICEKAFATIFLDYPIEICSDMNARDDDLLDIIKIRFKETDASLIEKLILYIKIAIELRKIKVFIFNGLEYYMSADDIIKFLSECKYLNVIIVNLETKESCHSLFDNKFIVDKDLCNL